MSRVALADEAISDLTRLYEFLAKYDSTTAAAALQAIDASFKILCDMPTGCPFVPGRTDLRKLVIDYGAKGYVAFFEYDPRTDIAVIVTIRHQNEQYDNATIGL